MHAICFDSPCSCMAVVFGSELRLVFSSAAKTTLVTLLEIWGELMMCLTDGFENSSIGSQELLPRPIDKGVVPKLIGISHAHKHQRVENLPLYSFFLNI